MAALPSLYAPREAVIRSALSRWIPERYGADATLVHELAIKHGDFRVDVCAITDELHGFEIKSDQDTLGRLPSQAKEFSLVFQRMTLVVGPKLIGAALALVPPWWGVLLATEQAGLTSLIELRAAMQNPKPNYRWVARLLWRDELCAALKARCVRGYSKLKYWQVANLVLEVFTPDELVVLVSRTLAERKGHALMLDLHEEPRAIPEDSWAPTDHSYWDDHCLA